MRIMAYGRWIGIRCDQCRMRSVSERGLPDAISTGIWFRHRRSLNRHICQGCCDALSQTERAEYVREVQPSGDAVSPRARHVSAR